MITEELVAYVKQQRQAGVADQAIREAILSVGWTEEDANQALSSSSAPSSSPTQTPSPFPQEPSSASQEPESAKISQQGKTNSTTPEAQKETVKESPSVSHPKEAATSSEIPPLDSQPGPIELDEQARPVTSASTSQKQESPRQETPLKTEEDLAKPVSFTNKDQDQPKEEASQPAQAPVLDQESEPNREKPVETKIEQEDKSPSSIAAKQPQSQPAQTPKQEEEPQVAVDPKAEEK